MTELAERPRATARTAPRLLTDVYDAASECNKCSLCQAVCPTYVTNPVEWESARGRVSLVRDAIEGRIDLADIADGPLSTCLACDNCIAACAPRVPTSDIVTRARAELNDRQGHPWGQSLALRVILARPGMLDLLHRLSRIAQATGAHALLRGTGLTRWLGTAGSLMERVGPLPQQTAHRQARDIPIPDGEPRADLVFLMCCYENLATADATAATLRVLAANGFRVHVPRLACSGLPARVLGDRQATRDMAARSVTALDGLRPDGFVGDSAACLAHYRRYGDILAADPVHAEGARRIATNIRLASDLLAERGVTAELGPLHWRVAYDAPCALDPGASRRPATALLDLIPALHLVDLEESAMCCGGGGDYFRRQPERSAAILARKFEHIRASGADVVVTENASCITQLRAGARRHAPRVRVLHLFEVLDESIRIAGRRRAVLRQY